MMSNEAQDAYDRGVEAGRSAERARRAEIVQMARAGDIDQDWRSVIHRIKGGDTVEQIRAEIAEIEASRNR